jgi:hypothetical protein
VTARPPFPHYAKRCHRGYRPHHVVTQIGPDDGYDTLRHRLSDLDSRLHARGIHGLTVAGGLGWEIERDETGRPVRMYAIAYPESFLPEIEAMLAERDEVAAKIRLWKHAGAT